MTKTYQPYSPRQAYLLPPSPLEWLPAGHPAYWMLDVVAALDLSEFYAYYERQARGAPPFNPQMMVGLLLYGYCVGVASSRKIERRTYEDVAFRVIAGGQHPDHTRISEFRRIHLKALERLFVQVLRLCQKAGLVKLGHIAIDGTKVKANASKHKAMSYEYMKKKEAELEQRVRELLSAAEAADQQEDREYGKGVRGDELPEELRRAESRLERIREAKAALEAEAKQQREQKPREKKPSDDDGRPPVDKASELPSHRVPTLKDGSPTPKAQRNFTDPDSRIQKAGNGFIQGYNAQTAVDAERQIIVAHAVTNQSPDVEHLVPMLDRVNENCQQAPKKMSADTGYFSDQNVHETEARGVEPYIATGRQKHGEIPVSTKGRPKANLTLKERMRRKLATKKGAQVYARRKAIVEPPFGYIKAARGFRQFLLRGIEKVRGEWSLICLTHNLLKLHAAEAAN